jgi:hypothetical protein
MAGSPRYRTTFVRLLGFLRPYKLAMAISIVLAIGTQATAIVATFLSGSVADALRHHKRSEL